MPPVKKNKKNPPFEEKAKSDKSTTDKLDSPTVKASNQEKKSTNSDNSSNVGTTTEQSISSQPIQTKNVEDLSFDKNSSEEIGSSLHLSPSQIFESSSGANNLSFRKISMEVASLLPLEQESDESEGEEETKKAEKGNEIPTNSNVEEGNSEPVISNAVKAMTVEQMQEHITCCLQLNTENKINAKNAFALKLIDCMTLMLKNQDESNFAAMACQLDAGTKIYSHRVDAVHQQVMKLAESCAYAARKDTKKKQEDNSEDEGDANNDNLNDKERRTKIKQKKKILATREQITRKLKGKDPRDNFVQLEAKPGSIFNNARRDRKDLSLTLEKHIPFWRDPGAPVSRDGGTVPFPCYNEVKSIIMKHKKALEEAGRLNPVEPSSAQDENSYPRNVDYENPRPSSSHEDDHSHFEDAPDVYGADTTSEGLEEVTETLGNVAIKDEPHIVSLATNKMSMEMAGKPSRFDVLKALFYVEGESDYNYLKMENIGFWTGCTHWKRPKNTNSAGLKKKVSRRKKEPLEIKYGEEALKLNPKLSFGIVPAKRPFNLSKRTMANWKSKKVTYPPDIHFDVQGLYKLFNIDAKSLFSREEDKEKPASDEEGDASNMDGERDDLADDNTTRLDENNVTLSETSVNQISSDTTTSAEVCESEAHSSRENPAQSGPEEVQGSVQKEEADNNQSTKPSTSDGVYEGDNLVPMVKMVHVEPIRYVARPNRVDFHHLKDVMLHIINERMEDKENHNSHRSTESSTTPAKRTVAFKDVLHDLFNSNRLHHCTREDLTVPMAFLCLLTLTNENCFTLTQEENTGTEDILISYANE